MPVACQSRAGIEPAGETQSRLLRQSKDRCIVRCSGLFCYMTDGLVMIAGAKGGRKDNRLQDVAIYAERRQKTDRI